MPGHIVSPERTPVDAGSLLEIIGRSYTRLFATFPTRALCLVIIGQAFIECGDGCHSCFCHDLGNVMARTGGQYDWCDLHGAWEVLPDGTKKTGLVEHFRAFASFDEGADQHLAFVHERFPSAFVAAMAGDGTAYAHELKLHGYYTGSEHDYVSGINAFMAKYAYLPPAPWEVEASQMPVAASETEPAS